MNIIRNAADLAVLLLQNIAAKASHLCLKVSIVLLEVAQACYEARQRKGSEPA